MLKAPRQADHRSIRVVQFLDAYQKQESLWNPALESYKNKHLRDEAYNNIIRELKLPSLTINDIKLKVKSIRTTYTKELRLLTKHKEEGRAYQPKLFWFNRAHDFLKHVSLSREKRQNLLGGKSSNPCVIEFINDDMTHNDHNDDDMVDTGDLDDHCNTSSSYDYKSIQPTLLETHLHDGDDIHMRKPSRTEAVHSMNHQLSEELASSTGCTLPKISLNHSTTTTLQPITTAAATTTTNCSSTSTSSAPPDDEYDLFCRSVCAQLRHISDNYSRSVAKLKIQQILFEAETGHYRNNSGLP